MATDPLKPESKHLGLKIERPDLICSVAKALSSPVRVEMLRLVSDRSMNVNELAEALSLPMSTAAMNVRVLEAAGLFTCEMQPGVRGAMKLCSRRLDSISISLLPPRRNYVSILMMQLPIGHYSLVGGIRPTCGLAGEHAIIGEDDNPRSFYTQTRFDAQLMWFRSGFVEYHFTILNPQDIDIEWLEFSFEACSEAPSYRDPWKSDISVAVNGITLGTWTSPADFGGRRGRLNPNWWPDLSTQYGMLKTWRVTKTGSYLEDMHLSDVTVDQLNVLDQEHIALRIYVSADAENQGGINLFGERFGDHPQNIVMRVGYNMRAYSAMDDR